MITIGIIGVGRWGPNILRNFIGMDGVRVEAICDSDNKRLEAITKRYPEIKTTTDTADIIGNRQLTCTVIATPLSTHFPLAEKALEAGLAPMLQSEASLCASCRSGSHSSVHSSSYLQPGRRLERRSRVIACSGSSATPSLSCQVNCHEINARACCHIPALHGLAYSFAVLLRASADVARSEPLCDVGSARVRCFRGGRSTQPFRRGISYGPHAEFA